MEFPGRTYTIVRSYVLGYHLLVGLPVATYQVLLGPKSPYCCLHAVAGHCRPPTRHCTRYSLGPFFVGFSFWVIATPVHGKYSTHQFPGRTLVGPTQ